MSEQTPTAAIPPAQSEVRDEPVRPGGLADAFRPSKTVREGRGGALTGLVKRSTARPAQSSEQPSPETKPKVVQQPEPVATQHTHSEATVADDSGEVERPASPRRARPQNQPRVARSAGRQSAAARQGGGAARPSAKTVVVRLTQDASNALARERGITRRTNTELVLLALEHQHLRLGDLLRAQAAPVVKGILFTITAAPQRQLRTQVSLRLSADQVQVIDELVAQHDAFDRGELIEVAIKAEYGHES